MRIILFFLSLLLTAMLMSCSDNKKIPASDQPIKGGVQLLRKTDDSYASLRSSDVLFTTDILYFSETYTVNSNNKNLKIEKFEPSKIILQIKSVCKTETEVETFEEHNVVNSNQVSLGELLPARLFLSKSTQAICSVNIETVLAGRSRSFYFSDRTFDLKNLETSPLLFEQKADGSVNYDLNFDLESINKSLFVVQINDAKKIIMNCEGFRSEQITKNKLISLEEISGNMNIVDFKDFYHPDSLESDSRKTLFKQKCILSVVTSRGALTKSPIYTIVFPVPAPQARYVVEADNTRVTQYLYRVTLTNTHTIPIRVAVPREELYMDDRKVFYFAISVIGGSEHINLSNGSVILDSLKIAILSIKPGESIVLLATTDGKNEYYKDIFRKIVPIYALRKSFYTDEEFLNITREDLATKIPMQY